MKTLRAGAGVAALIFCAAPAFADQTSVGVTLNATTGSHVESSRTSSVPLLPLPMLEIDHAHGQYRIHLEGVPQLGAVPLAQSDPYSESIAPRVSYLNGELLYQSTVVPLEIGIGETILNQQTVDHDPFFPDGKSIHYSRVVGMRLAARAQIAADSRHRLDVSVGVNPAMHGLEDGKYGEDASLFDGSLRWTLMRSRYDVVYGLRYLNYTAAYSSDHSLGDRNHLFMPFIGIDWHGKERLSVVNEDDPPASSPFQSKRATTVGISLLGSNGSRAYTNAYTQTPLNFVLIPQLQITHSFGRYEIEAEGILPNNNANPFGSTHNRWSYVSAGALANVGKSPLSLGLGETATNLAQLGPPRLSDFTSRSQAVDLLARLNFARMANNEAYVFLRAEPYVHVISYTNLPGPGFVSSSNTSIAHGARVDATLGRNLYIQRFIFNYGLRYINQTTNYFTMGNGVFLTRSTSLMPFVGINARF